MLSFRRRGPLRNVVVLLKCLATWQDTGRDVVFAIEIWRHTELTLSHYTSRIDTIQ